MTIARLGKAKRAQARQLSMEQGTGVSRDMRGPKRVFV